MSEIKNIAVIGATGKLAIPVASELARHYNVRAIVRNPQKARTQLPTAIELVAGDLKNRESLEDGLQGQDAIYINLATETTDATLPFYEEREGVRNVVEAAQRTRIKYISKIGALGAYPLATHVKGANVLPNIIRTQGHKFIEESGIPYTIFDPTTFMDLMLWINNGKAIRWIGNAKKKIRWISSDDYAKQVLAAFRLPQFWNKHYPVQGPEAIDPLTAMSRFASIFNPQLTVSTVPVGVIQAIGLVNPKMRFLGHMFSYFEKQDDPFYAEDTWRELGTPTTSIEGFARLHRVKLPTDVPLARTPG
jgi:uncharacterized protein YbjT (DUF2867 family)